MNLAIRNWYKFSVVAVSLEDGDSVPGTPAQFPILIQPFLAVQPVDVAIIRGATNLVITFNAENPDSL